DSLQELTNHWLFNHQSEIKPVQVISVDQIETCKQFMKEGLGMAVLPQSVSGSLKEVYPHLPLVIDGQLMTRDTWLCYRSDIRKLPQVNSFKIGRASCRERVKNEVGEGAWIRKE